MKNQHMHQPSLSPLVSYRNGGKGTSVLDEPVTMLARKESGRTENQKEPGIFCYRSGDLRESKCDQMNKENRVGKIAFQNCSV